MSQCKGKILNGQKKSIPQLCLRAVLDSRRWTICSVRWLYSLRRRPFRNKKRASNPPSLTSHTSHLLFSLCRKTRLKLNGLLVTWRVISLRNTGKQKPKSSKASNSLMNYLKQPISMDLPLFSHNNSKLFNSALEHQKYCPQHNIQLALWHLTSLYSSFKSASQEILCELI
jgi:hypothetical protein